MKKPDVDILFGVCIILTLVAALVLLVYRF